MNTFSFLNLKSRIHRKISFYLHYKFNLIFLLKSLKFSYKLSFLAIKNILDLKFYLLFKLFKIRYIDSFFSKSSFGKLYIKLFYNHNLFKFISSIYKYKTNIQLENSKIYALPAKRSVLFFGHSYYNFLYLSKALKKRNWDALNCSIDSPKDDNTFNHGSELNLYDSDKSILKKKVNDFFFDIPKRFSMVHLYGVGNNSIFRNISHQNNLHENFVPLDLLYLKNYNIKIGYTTSGCLDGTSQKLFNKWTNGVCNKCVWKKNPIVCNDDKNLLWGKKRNLLMDLFASETCYALEYQGNNKCFREPLTQALDKNLWNTQNPLNFNKRIKILHSVGNFKQRTTNQKNIKGSKIIFNNIKELIKDGFNIELINPTNNIDSKEYINIIKNSDIVIDQLNFGRFGSITREALMLNKPVIVFINPKEPKDFFQLQSLKELPIISSSEKQFKNVFIKTINSYRSGVIKKNILRNKYRNYAIRWFAAENCAERFEKVYDGLFENRKPFEIEKQMFPNRIINS